MEGEGLHQSFQLYIILLQLKKVSTGKNYIILESSSGGRCGIDVFYDLKPRAPGEKIKAPNIKNGCCFVQSTSQNSNHYLKAGSLVLYEV